MIKIVAHLIKAKECRAWRKTRITAQLINICQDRNPVPFPFNSCNVFKKLYYPFQSTNINFKERGAVLNGWKIFEYYGRKNQPT